MQEKNRQQVLFAVENFDKSFLERNTLLLRVQRNVGRIL